jgi:hypothetical protein
MNLITSSDIIFIKKVYRVAAEGTRGSSHESLFIKISDPASCPFIQPTVQESLA